MAYFIQIKNKLLRQGGNFKNAGLYFLASILGMVSTLLVNPFLSLNLSHDDFALIGYFGSFNTLFTPLISFSIFSYYSRQFFMVNEEQRERLRNTVIISLLIMSSIFSLFSFVSLYIYFKVTNVVFPFFPYALLTIVSLFFTNFYSLMLVDLKMKRLVKKYFWIYVIRSTLVSAFAYLFVVILKEGSFGRLFATAITALAFGTIDFKRMLTKWEFDKDIFIDIIKFSWPLCLAGMLNYFFSGVDRAMLEKTGNLHELGLYNIAIQIASYLTIFSSTLGQTYQPDILQSIAERKKKKTIKIVGGLTLMNIVPIALFVLFAPIIIDILTYGRYTDATNYARILSLKALVDSVYFSISTIIIGYGFSKITLWNKLIGTIFIISIFKILIDKFGFYGAAWGQVLSFVVMIIISLLFLYYKLRIKKKTVF